MEKAEYRVRVTEKTVKRLNKYRSKVGKVSNDFIINEGLDKLTERMCACGQHWGHTGKHWANTEVKS